MVQFKKCVSFGGGEWVDYYGLNICIPLQFICSSPNPQYDIWRWGFGKVIRS